jgi:hypothetical protein
VKLLVEGLAVLQEKFSLNRVVALFTVFVAVPAGGWLSAYAATHFPGLPHFSAGDLTKIIAVGGASALAIGYKWLHGWQEHEARIFYGKPGPGEPSDMVEIAEIEAAAQKAVALIGAGQIHADDVGFGQVPTAPAPPAFVSPPPLVQPGPPPLPPSVPFDQASSPTVTPPPADPPDHHTV